MVLVQQFWPRRPKVGISTQKYALQRSRRSSSESCRGALAFCFFLSGRIFALLIKSISFTLQKVSRRVLKDYMPGRSVAIESLVRARFQSAFLGTYLSSLTGAGAISERCISSSWILVERILCVIDTYVLIFHSLHFADKNYHHAQIWN